MSISSKVSATTSAISEINTDNLESQKPRATSAANAIKSEWDKIESLSRTAKGNDGEIMSTARAAQQQLESALDAAVRQLQASFDAANEQLQTTLRRAQEDFESTATAIRNNLANSISTMESTKSENDGVHDNISSIAS